MLTTMRKSFRINSWILKSICLQDGTRTSPALVDQQPNNKQAKILRLVACLLSHQVWSIAWLKMRRHNLECTKAPEIAVQNNQSAWLFWNNSEEAGKLQTFTWGMFLDKHVYYWPVELIIRHKFLGLGRARRAFATLRWRASASWIWISRWNGQICGAIEAVRRLENRQSHCGTKSTKERLIWTISKLWQ